MDPLTDFRFTFSVSSATDSVEEVTKLADALWDSRHAGARRAAKLTAAGTPGQRVDVIDAAGQLLGHVVAWRLPAGMRPARPTPGKFWGLR